MNVEDCSYQHFIRTNSINITQNPNLKTKTTKEQFRPGKMNIQIQYNVNTTEQRKKLSKKKKKTQLKPKMDSYSNVSPRSTLFFSSRYSSVLHASTIME